MTCSTGDTRCHTPGMGTARREQRWGCQTDPAAGTDVATRARTHGWIHGGQGNAALGRVPPPQAHGEPWFRGFPPAFARAGSAGPCFQPHGELAWGCTRGVPHKAGGCTCVWVHTCRCTCAWMCMHVCVPVVCVPAGVHVGSVVHGHMNMCANLGVEVCLWGGACTWGCTGGVYMHIGVPTCLCAHGCMCVCAYMHLGGCACVGVRGHACERAPVWARVWVCACLGQPRCLLRPKEAEHTWLQLWLCCLHRAAGSKRQHRPRTQGKPCGEVPCLGDSGSARADCRTSCPTQAHPGALCCQCLPVGVGVSPLISRCLGGQSPSLPGEGRQRWAAAPGLVGEGQSVGPPDRRWPGPSSEGSSTWGLPR